MNHFYDMETVHFADGSWRKSTTDELLRIQQASVEVQDSEGNVVVKAGRKFLKPALRKMKKAGMLTAETREVDGKSAEVFVGSIPVADDAIIGRVSSMDIVDMETGEVLVECNEELTEESVSMLLDMGITEIETLYIDNVIVGSFLRDTLLVDKIESTEEGVMEIIAAFVPASRLPMTLH